jgi:hypothetical protein
MLFNSAADRRWSAGSFRTRGMSRFMPAVTLAGSTVCERLLVLLAIR